MNNSLLVSKDELITKPKELKPHVVILGAGASIAATLPDGDKYGKRLPDMANFIDVLDLRKLLIQENIDLSEPNFEKIFSDLYLVDPNSELIRKIEDTVYDYFSSLELPNVPTIYDHLVLSLRPKDAIFTFNWDPFLFDTLIRHDQYFDLPKIFYLHGNVRIGYCDKDFVWGRNGDICPQCGNEYISPKLLYPITQKDYTTDKYIREQWDLLEYFLANAFTFTIFGYGAPSTDIKAIEVMKNAWKKESNREIENIQIIDIKPREQLHNTWRDFIFSHHYSVHAEFYTSIIARYPRRTCEALYWPKLYGKPVEAYSLPRNAGYSDLYDWYSEITKFE
ncbi:MAG: hypothetical protein O7D86_02640 [Proteobacteria bacterium]|nr:hypothetical protein [Pseudomonadota bacterium]